MSINLERYIPIEITDRYDYARRTNIFLPRIYGDMRENSIGGVWECPCISTITHRYLIADRSILSVMNGNTIEVFENGIEAETNYTVYTSQDDGSGHNIAYIDFDEEPQEPISVSCAGLIDDYGRLIEDPMDIIEDWLELTNNLDYVDETSWLTARQLSASYEYKAAGVINSEESLAYWLNEILTEFLGDMYINSRGKLVIRLDTLFTQSIKIAGILDEAKIGHIKAERLAKNLANQIPYNYAITYGKVDRRYNNQARENYFVTDDGNNTKSATSQLRFGEKTPDNALSSKWIRNTSTINKLQERIISKHAEPLWLITCEEIGLDNILAETGDGLIFSWRGMKDENGNDLQGQIMQVLDKNIDANNHKITWKLKDTGQYYPQAPDLWDGSRDAGDGGYFGGGRRVW